MVERSLVVFGAAAPGARTDRVRVVAECAKRTAIDDVTEAVDDGEPTASAAPSLALRLCLEDKV